VQEDELAHAMSPKLCSLPPTRFVSFALFKHCCWLRPVDCTHHSCFADLIDVSPVLAVMHACCPTSSSSWTACQVAAVTAASHQAAAQQPQQQLQNSKC
jgi:hypothetical protein